jgi:oxygen-independent coproporphyrinogen-3 oxidase
MEDYFERVVERLTAAGYRWYETANFCVDPEHAEGRDLRARHNLAYWRGRDYLGIGIGAVSTVQGRRWRTTPRLGAYLAALARGEGPPRELEPLPPSVRRRERVLLGLRLDEPLALRGLESAVDPSALDRLEELGLAARTRGGDAGENVTLTTRGRFLGGAVAAELLA